jgi:hypothetical protein
VAGITAEVFLSLLSPEDIKDIAAGAIHSKTLRAYAQSFAEGIRSGRLVLAARAKQFSGAQEVAEARGSDA